MPILRLNQSAPWKIVSVVSLVRLPSPMNSPFSLVRISQPV